MTYGRYLEELEAGQTSKRWPGLMSMDQHPLHIDEHDARGTQHGRRLVEGPLAISLAIGMSQADIGGRALRTVEYSDVRHLCPGV